MWCIFSYSIGLPAVLKQSHNSPSPNGRCSWGHGKPIRTKLKQNLNHSFLSIVNDFYFCSSHYGASHMWSTIMWRTELKIAKDSQEWMVKCIQYFKYSKGMTRLSFQQCNNFLTFIRITKYHDLTKYKSNSVALARIVAVVVGDIPHSDGHFSADDGMPVPACHIFFKQPFVFTRKVATFFVTFTISNTYIFSRPVI